jgi:phosphopantothenoylcysteine decarboxylase/phosphopantothenate--cysteine ligase
MNTLTNKRIVLGVTGGIAAYKAAELVRRLGAAGAAVRVVMTRSAQEFAGPLTFQALSGNPVHTDLLDRQAEAAMGHIELARWADAIVLAPASANSLARLAHGLADDLLSTLCLASSAPLTVVPAMNQQMWQALATQENLAALRRRGVQILGPAAGSQACGEIGPGRMLEPDVIVAALSRNFSSGALAGLNVLVTAGPTREAIDPVRYISNRSSGRMGYAVAEASAEAGARVTLVSGPTQLDVPATVRRVDVVSAQQMADAVAQTLAGTDIFIAAAAVADFRCADIAPHKHKRSGVEWQLNLVPNPDILAGVAATAVPPFTVGFAAETQELAAHARAKLQAKAIDMIAANDVSAAGRGFDSDLNALQVFWRGGEAELPLAPKTRLARQLVSLIAERYREKNRS